MAGQNVRRRDTGYREQRVQIFCQPRRDAGRVGWIAPTEPRSIIGAGACESSDLGLKGRPVERRGRDSRFENYRGTAMPRLDKMQATFTTNVDQATAWGKFSFVRRRSSGLVEEARENENRDQRSDEEQNFQTRDSTAISAAGVSRRQDSSRRLLLLVLDGASTRRSPMAVHRRLQSRQLLLLVGR